MDKITTDSKEYHQPANTIKALDVIEVDDQYLELANICWAMFLLLKMMTP
jgi:hypothetical protein